MIRLLGSRAPAVLLALSLALPGCASALSSASSGSRSVITRLELQEEQLEPFSTHEVIQRLRPNWLRSRGGTLTSGPLFAVVVVDGTARGDLSTLHSIPASDVLEIRYRGARDATTRYGTGYVGGAIEILTRH